ncbi:TlpA family protein disulfide reductase [Tenacibaculum haliotis]|uniref:TlpA family protein disulfide reductase n=1 Tax=Tenacibaculum haliotis TaxID=1888914 RepID=UPI0021B03B57|nr:TlpA disulfide reductase family protein [Tenacibaculum haliotis]MCT4699154.1 TlpA family protein disulfide reductase [Tenacibaculum haliotis]
MRNIILALLSIIIGFALSLFTLNTYLKGASKNDKSEETVKKEAVVAEKVTPEVKEIEKPIEVEKPVEVEEAATNDTEEKEESAINTDNVQESFENWNAYNKQNIDLMSTFIPLDNKGAIMDKGIFLVSLRTGAYIAIKSINEKNEIQYQLTNIEDPTSIKIKKSMVSKATIAYQYFKMEGKKLPRYDFVDLEGTSHNKADTEGKIVVLKCWFITCKVCVEEFPQLNALVDKYKDDDIEFVSLAFDEKDKLVEFLKTKPFKYTTVPNQKKYMAKKLKVKQYPTHLIVDANGVILKMVNNVKTLTSELERVVGK